MMLGLSTKRYGTNKLNKKNTWKVFEYFFYVSEKTYKVM